MYYKQILFEYDLRGTTSSPSFINEFVNPTKGTLEINLKGCMTHYFMSRCCRVSMKVRPKVFGT